MGVLVSVATDPESRLANRRYPDHAVERAWSRADVDLPPATVRRRPDQLLVDGRRVAEAGFDPERFYRLLGYDLTEPPGEATAVERAATLSTADGTGDGNGSASDGGDRDDGDGRGSDGRDHLLWSTDETAWVSEAAWEAGIDRLATVCYAAITFDRVCRVERR